MIDAEYTEDASEAVATCPACQAERDMSSYIEGAHSSNRIIELYCDECDQHYIADITILIHVDTYSL